MPIDSLKPALLNHFRQAYIGRAAASALLLRTAVVYFEPRVFCVPDDTNIDIAAASPFEGKLSLPPLSRIWALAGSSSQAEGFDLQLIDGGTHQPIFGKRAFFGNVTGQGAGPDGIRNALFVLPKPLLILEPGQVLVQVFNRSPLVNTIQVALYVAIPKEVQP